VAGSRVLSSRPGWGLVQFQNTGANQAGERVLSFIGSAFVERRPQMTVEPQLAMTVGEDRPASSRDKRRTMAVALPAHALHDGYSDLVYVMLPIWQAEFALSYAAVGLLRSTLSGTMAAFQIPAGLLAERIGGAAVLAGGTALAGLCFCL